MILGELITQVHRYAEIARVVDRAADKTFYPRTNAFSRVQGYECVREPCRIAVINKNAQQRLFGPDRLHTGFQSGHRCSALIGLYVRSFNQWFRNLRVFWSGFFKVRLNDLIRDR